MGRFLVLAPVDGDDESLFVELERLAAREASHFHVVVPRQPAGRAVGDAAVAEHLGIVVEALIARGFDADGEVGELSVIGSVARAVERARYDAIVVPVPAVGVLDTIDLEVAHRLHQIDVPLVIVPPRRRQQPVVRPGSWPAGLVVGFLLIGVLALLVGVLLQTEHPTPGSRTRNDIAPPAFIRFA